MSKHLFFPALFAVFIFANACTHKKPTDPTTGQKAKAMYRKVINLRFVQPDRALAIADSILEMGAKNRLDTFYVAALSQKSLILSEKRQMPEALELAEKALQLWQPADGIFAKCKAHEQVGQCHLVNRNYGAALPHFQKELELAPQCGEKALGIETYAAGYVADAFHGQLKFKEALQFYQHGLACAEKLGDPELIAGELNNMSKIFKSMGDPAQQMAQLKRAAACFDSTDNRRAAAYLNIANNFILQKQDDSANVYILKVYQMKDLPPLFRLIGMVGYAGILTEKKEFAAARKLCGEAILLAGADSVNDQLRVGIALNQIGETFHDEKKYAGALRFSLKADSVLRDEKTEQDFQTKFEASRNVVQFQLLADGHPKIAEHLENMVNYRDSVQSAEHLEILEEFKNQVKSDSIALLSAQNQIQTATIKNKNWMLWLVGLGSLLLGFLAFFWKKNLRLASENLEIMDEQNQKLENDNRQFREELATIRAKTNGDKSSMLDQTIILPTRNNLTLRLGDIMYIQAFGGGVHYFTPEKKHLVWHGFEESMKMLPEEFFVKTHRSYIVNKKFVEQVSPAKIFLKNGESLPIGVTIKEEVRERLGF